MQISVLQQGGRVQSAAVLFFAPTFSFLMRPVVGETLELCWLVILSSTALLRWFITVLRLCSMTEKVHYCVQCVCPLGAIPSVSTLAVEARHFPGVLRTDVLSYSRLGGSDKGAYFKPLFGYTDCKDRWVSGPRPSHGMNFMVREGRRMEDVDLRQIKKSTLLNSDANNL